MVLHNIYFSLRSGTCLYSRVYGSIAQDPQLVTCSLTALDSVYQAVLGTQPQQPPEPKEEMHIATYDKYKFITLDHPLTETESLRFMAVCDPHDEDRVCEKLARKSMQAFRRFVHEDAYKNCVDVGKIQEEFDIPMAKAKPGSNYPCLLIMDYLHERFKEELSESQNQQKERTEQIDRISKQQYLEKMMKEQMEKLQKRLKQ